MFHKFLHWLFNGSVQPAVKTTVSDEAPSDATTLTGKDFEFLITPGDIDIPAADFDSIMTPDSFGWEKVVRGNWPYYQIGADEFTYSWEPPGIQMTFNEDMLYPKAKAIADEVVRKLTVYTGQSIDLVFISSNVPIRFDNIAPAIPAMSKGRYLFTVEDRFSITGRGLVLYPGFGNNFAKIGSKIKLIRPDQSIVETIIRGVSFSENHDILVGENVKKEDVPVGTEVWLQE